MCKGSIFFLIGLIFSQCITDLYNHLTIEQMRESCQSFGGSLASDENNRIEDSFFAQLGHLGAAAFMSELPVLEDDKPLFEDYIYGNVMFC